jgi:hypothetical protein
MLLAPGNPRLFWRTQNAASMPINASTIGPIRAESRPAPLATPPFCGVRVVPDELDTFRRHRDECSGRK